MQASAPQKDRETPHRHGLCILLWVLASLAAAVGAGIVLVTGWPANWDRPVRLGGATALFTTVSLIAAAVSFHKQQEVHGAIFLTIALAASSIAYVVLSPGGFVFIALLPVIIMVIVLPFVKRTRLAWVLLGIWFAGAATIIIATLWSPPTRLPLWIPLVFRVAVYMALLALTFVLFYRHHQRLSESLTSARSERQASDEARRDIEKTNQKMEEKQQRLEKNYQSLLENYQRLSQSNRARLGFLNAAAHELRTPLTPILLHTSMMRQNPAIKDEQKIQHSVDVVERNVRRLKSHMDDLVEVSRLQYDQYTFRLADVPLDDLLQELRKTFGPIAEEQGVKLHIKEARTTIRADPDRIMQVLFNLVMNALEATGHGDQIRVTTNRRDGECVVYVRDTGAGFDPAEREHIFQPFTEYQHGKSTKRAGLGLYICKNIIEGHGNTIDCISPGPGKGAMFWFTLPTAEAAGDTSKMTSNRTSQPLHADRDPSSERTNPSPR